MSPGLEVDAVTATRPVAVDRTVMSQRWTDLTYLHWAYDPEVVQRLLPDGLAVDTLDGRAWVGLVPFVMRDVRLGPRPGLPWPGAFVETNVRTYVVDRTGRRSVWFWSLDVPRLLPMAVARLGYGLPYCWGRASFDRTGDRIRYTNERRWPRAAAPDGGRPRTTIVVDLGAALAPGEASELEHFLTARWGLVTRRRGRLVHAAVDHEAWPLQRAELVDLDDSLVVAAGLPAPRGAPLVHHAPGVTVGIGRQRRLR